MGQTLQDLREAILTADDAAALASTRELLAAGVEPRVVLEEGLAAAMLELGRRWNRGEAFLVEVVASADVFRQCGEVVEPVLLARGQKKAGRLVVIGTVHGDLHDLGKNIVGAMLKTAGFEVTDLGRDVSAERFALAVAELKPHLLGLSALLTTTMMEQKVVIETLKTAGLRDRVKVLVGGAPVTAEWAAEIGADAYAANAPQAVEVALDLVGAGGAGR